MKSIMYLIMIYAALIWREVFRRANARMSSDIKGTWAIWIIPDVVQWYDRQHEELRHYNPEWEQDLWGLSCQSEYD